MHSFTSITPVRGAAVHPRKRAIGMWKREATADAGERLLIGESVP